MENLTSKNSEYSKTNHESHKYHEYLGCRYSKKTKKTLSSCLRLRLCCYACRIFLVSELPDKILQPNHQSILDSNRMKEKHKKPFAVNRLSFIVYRLSLAAKCQTSNFRHLTPALSKSKGQPSDINS